MTDKAVQSQYVWVRRQYRAGAIGNHKPAFVRLQKRPLKQIFSVLNRIRVVVSSGEYRPLETASGHPGAGTSAQPHSYNPRKQRKNPAEAGSGERVRKGKWRRERDCRRTFSDKNQMKSMRLTMARQDLSVYDLTPFGSVADSIASLVPLVYWLCHRVIHSSCQCNSKARRTVI